MTSVVITGSRDWPITKAHLIWEALRKIHDYHMEDWHWTGLELHHGECYTGGADLVGASWAAGAGWEVIPHPPVIPKGWALAERNQKMIDLMPDYVVVCYLGAVKGRGTQMTYDMAIAAGLKDRIIEVRG